MVNQANSRLKALATAAAILAILVLLTATLPAPPVGQAKGVAGPAPATALTTQADGLAGPAGPGGDFLVSTVAVQPEGDANESAIAYNTLDDEYLVVWQDECGGSFDIYGQFYSAQGVPLRENFAIAGGTHTQINPAVAHNRTNNQYLVVWQESVGITGYGVYAQRLDPDGNLLGGSVVLHAPALIPGYPTVFVAHNTVANEYLVTWDDARNSATTGRDIYGQRVRGSDGALLGSNFPVNADAGDQFAPKVVHNTTANQYLVVWGTSPDVFAQRVAANGTLVGAKWQAGTPGADKGSWAVAWNSTRNEYLVAWSDYSTIYGQRFHADGSMDQGPFAISSGVGQIFPAVAYDPSAQQYLVVWQDTRNWDATSSDIYGQRIYHDEDGHAALARQGNFAISKAPNGQISAAVAYGATSHQFLVAWWDQDEGQGAGQRVWWPGLLLGHNFTIGAPVHAQETPAVAYNRLDDEFLAVWSDERNGDFDIYGQRYDREGLPLGDNFVIVESAGDEVHPGVAYNTAANEYLVVWESPGLFGVYGQRLRAQGTAIGDAFPLFNETGIRKEPAVAYDGATNQYLVAYVYVGSSWQIYGTRVSGDGRLLGWDMRICEDAGDQDQVDVAHNPTNQRFIVVWRSKQADTGDVYARFVEADGSMPSTKFVVSAAADAQSAPAVAWNRDDNQYLVVWYDYRNSDTTGSDIYAQRFLGAGGSQGGNLRVSTSSGAFYEQYPDVVYVNLTDRYRVVWQDDREMATLGWDIRGQWVSRTGTVIGAFDDPICRYPGYQERPAIVYEEGEDLAFVAWQDGRNGVDYDIYGSFGAIDTTPPTARFTRDPNWGRAGDTFAFNAWPSSDDHTPRGDLLVRWDLNNDGAWDTPLGFDKYITRTVGAVGIYTVTLEVWDQSWYTDTVSHRIVVLPALASEALAAPPTATLAVTPTFGTAGTSFSCDASGSQGTGLTVRWDWENDGVFDTSFGSTLTASHAYTVAGDYTIRAEVRDNASGLSDAALRNVTVQPGAPVGLIISPAAVTMTVGEAFRFRATAWDTYNNEMFNPTVAWAVTNGAAGAINSGGVFTASFQAGAYANVIQATSSSASDTASVTIVWPYHLYLPLVLLESP